MISCICGLPGSGKNVYATHLAIKHYKRTNSLIKRVFRRIKHEETIINNIYTSYPILLDKKKNIYSRIVTPNDLQNQYSFLEGSIIIIDEIQSFYDSDEYKHFPKQIGVFNQFHRHFGISDIYYISQHPSRIVKKLRNVACQFIKIRHFIQIPFLNIGIMYYSNYYEFEDYGKWHHPVKEMRNYDVDNHFAFINLRRVFKSYNSFYLYALNYDKPLLDKGTFNHTYLTDTQLNAIFGNYIWTSRDK